MEKLLIIIPAWNEEEALPSVLEEIRHTEDLRADVIVVDDGSSDRTGDVALEYGAEVLVLPINLGVGGAMRAGYVYAQRKGYDYAVQVDADGQHRPKDILKLIQRMKDTKASIVIGARFAGIGDYEVHGPRSWAMRVLSKRLSRVCHTKLTDTTSGFKLADKTAIKLFSRELPAEYLGDTIEALVIAAGAGLKIDQEAVEMRERQAGEPSHGPIVAALFLFRALVAMAVAGHRRAEGAD
ncbi:MAG: glycosyltransferase family 2 protein [Ancrocorticia sp.]|jgi:glycosyltransferase involved in cell wall biosynthesis|nr:glycosyltransferase family 2 protein [Ancrocorticia sp.]